MPTLSKLGCRLQYTMPAVTYVENAFFINRRSMLKVPNWF